MNENGLTFSRWFAAATYGVPVGRWGDFETYTAMRAAWRAGEDPTEWAYALSVR